MTKMAKKENQSYEHNTMMTMMNKILVKQEKSLFVLVIFRQRESLATLPVTSEVNMDLGLPKTTVKAKAKDLGHKA